jgi:hypothetical protein
MKEEQRTSPTINEIKDSLFSLSLSLYVWSEGTGVPEGQLLNLKELSHVKVCSPSLHELQGLLLGICPTARVRGNFKVNAEGKVVKIKKPKIRRVWIERHAPLFIHFLRLTRAKNGIKLPREKKSNVSHVQ